MSELFGDLRRFVERHGVRVELTEMDIEKPGAFDGLSITINTQHDVTAASYYLAHSLGSIVQWSTDTASARRVYDELREAKRQRERSPEGFDNALEQYRIFEQTSSEHAVWTLAETGHAAAIDEYTMFFRADIEAMTIFHRTGKEPRWPEFYGEWKRRVAAGDVRIDPFVPRPFGSFHPVRIEPQEVLQERD